MSVPPYFRTGSVPYFRVLYSVDQISIVLVPYFRGLYSVDQVSIVLVPYFREQYSVVQISIVLVAYFRGLYSIVPISIALCSPQGVIRASNSQGHVITRFAARLFTCKL